MSDSNTPTPEDLNTRFQEARALHKAGRLAEARGRYEALLGWLRRKRD